MIQKTESDEGLKRCECWAMFPSLMDESTQKRRYYGAPNLSDYTRPRHWQRITPINNHRSLDMRRKESDLIESQIIIKLKYFHKSLLSAYWGSLYTSLRNTLVPLKP